MALFITSLNSGSNGNCYYIGNHSEAVLIDAGISCRETEKRMKRLGLSMNIVKAIFVSHEHSDHITGICGLSKKYQLPVYITDSTLNSSGLPIDKKLVHPFQSQQKISIGSLSITPFVKFHDASDPHSFMVSGDKINIGIFTDIGSPCKNVISHFKKCHAAFLEANYCENMLMNGKYPLFLKNRISGDQGHLSNAQALRLFLEHKGKQLSHLILSHLSKNNNRPELVDKMFNENAGNVKIVVASRYEETPLFYIGSTRPEVKKYDRANQLQLSLF
ncbi:MAG TPA: MBL fold metallo-hydrolase [Chitinophagaceae bacterium]|nr:MBL fold metallo-hydrolase [Chitinophagaceae bacterium]